MCKHHASTGLTINDGTLEDMPTSNISNIITITTVVSIMVTTVNGGSRCVASQAPSTVSFFFPLFIIISLTH